jgi:hypothetical protein
MTDGFLRHPFLRRVPLLLLAVAGVFLWRSELFPQPRTLLFELPPSVEVSRAEVQLWKGPSLAARAEWLSSPSSPLVLKVQLRTGTYRALSFLAYADGRTAQQTQLVELGSQETLHLSLQPR